jgi:hypothetical protein
MSEPHVTFGVSSHEFTEVLRLDKEGMHYKGEVVQDAGEAHRIFLTVMKQMEEESEQERKPWSPMRDPLMMCAIGLCAGLFWGALWAG